MSNGKFSISIGSGPSSSSAPTPKSNLELLMAKAKPAVAPSTKKKSITSLFDDEDDDHRAGPPPSLAGSTKSKPAIKQTALISRAERKAQEEALRVDQNVFDYDGVWEGMKAAERKLEEAKKLESEERKPKYIENFLASAQTRRLDRLRAEEKMLQLEREKEGEEFEGKEKFVTEAYKKQMAEVRKAEEEEKLRDGAPFDPFRLGNELTMWALDAMKKSKKGPGMTAFYKSMLDDDEAKHSAAMAASTGSTSAGPSLAIKRPAKPDYEPEAEYDPFLQREAASSTMSAVTGKEVEVNDDGQVVDNRSLLKAGLNIMKKPKPVIPNSLLTSQRSGNIVDGPIKSRAVGTAASYQERMERERRRLAEQIKEEEEKKRRAEEERIKDEEERARKRREGDDGEAERRRLEAKERFLARKRAREEEEEQKKRQKTQE
ncbi:coiled-coil domain-containing protein 55, partial [Tremellales sp. Uapishka_1]